jgi:hypothetical protein
LIDLIKSNILKHGDQFIAAFDVTFQVDIGDVFFDCAERNEQRIADLLIAVVL